MMFDEIIIYIKIDMWSIYEKDNIFVNLFEMIWESDIKVVKINNCQS